jgi:hypothetical protein
VVAWPGSVSPSEAGGRLRPSAWWYLAAVAVLVVGAVAGVLVIRNAIDDVDRRGRDVTRYPVNEQGTVTFDATGTYTLYFEGPAALIAAADPESLVSKLDIRFVEAATGEAVVLEPISDGDIAGHGPVERIAIMDVAIERPGDYLIEVRTSDFPPDISFVSVGRDPFRSLGRDLAIGLWLIGAAAASAVATAVGVGVSRGRSKRSRSRSYNGFGPAWPS